MKPLFVGGSPRSGTTGLANYLNQHQEILLCRERYKYGPRKVTPELFTFGRILDYSAQETNIPRDYHVGLLEKKDPANLKWIGDKYPTYVKQLKILARNNPGAHFIVPYRPVEEVAESFQARADNPNDKWPSENGFELGVQLWNSALRHTRDFIETAPNPRILVVGYHGFFDGSEDYNPLLSRFLEIDFDESIRRSWRDMSSTFEGGRRTKAPVSEEQTLFVRENKDEDTERWILDFMEEQRNNRGRPPATRRISQATKTETELKDKLATERRRAHQLARKNERLDARVQSLSARVRKQKNFEEQVRRQKRQISAMQNSRIWKLISRLTVVRAGVLKKLNSLIQRKNQPQESRNTRLNLEGYDFIDFGASKGASITFGLRRLGGTRGVGVDIDPEKVSLMTNKGYDCVELDATRLDLPPDSVRFVIMSHFLEHLPGLGDVKRSLESAAGVASDFLFIQGPYFDADELLREQGLKFYWSDWTGHPCHMTTSQLKRILLDLGLEDHVMMVCEEVADSADPSIHPLDSPMDQHEYNPEVHPEKPFVRFSKPLYRSIVCCVRLRPFDDWEKVLQAPKRCRTLEDGVGVEARSPHHGVDEPKRKEVDPLEEIKRRLILKKRWAYLRYLHTREALIQAKDIETVLVVGSGHGFAEIALALEFPEIHFHLTDIESERTPNYHRAQEMAQRWDLNNVSFGIRDILVPEQGRYDLVASVEVLEHIENDAAAVAAMCEAASKYVFALVPFSDKATNNDEAMRSSVWESHEHWRVGYDEEDLRELFPNVVTMRGCYWRARGGALRKRLYEMTNQEINAEMKNLQAEALNDIVDEIPEDLTQAQGIWVLAKV